MRANSSQYNLYCFGSFASSSAILKLKEDMENPSLKDVFDQQILVSVSQWYETYVINEIIQPVLS